MLIIVLLINIFNSYDACCNLQSKKIDTTSPQLNIFGNVKEQQKWPLNSLINGGNLTFSLKPSDSNFDVQQIIQIKASIDLPITVKRADVYTVDTSWKKTFTFYGELDGKNQIYIAKRNGYQFTWEAVCGKIEELQCYDIKFIKEDSIILVCFEDNEFIMYLCERNIMTRITETNQYIFTTLTDLKLAVILKDSVTIILGIITEEMQMIKAYNLVGNQLILNNQLTLSSETLSKLLQKEIILQLVDIQIDENYRLYILDSVEGVISLDLQVQDWLLIFRYYNLNYQQPYKYLQFTQGNTQGVKSVLIYSSRADLMRFPENSYGLYYVLVSFELDVRLAYLSTIEYFYIYAEKFGVFQIDNRYYNEIKRQPADQILINQIEKEIMTFSNKLQLYIYTRGYLILKSDSKVSKQEVDLVGSGPECTMQIKVVYQLFAYPNTDLYRSNGPIELQNIINYPQDNLANIPVTGSNIKVSITYDNEQVIKILTRQLQDLPLIGVTLPPDVIYLSILPGQLYVSNGGYNFYLIQTTDLKCTIIRCIYDRQMANQDCVQYVRFIPSIQLDDNMFQWDLDGQRIIVALVQKFKHVVNFYVLNNFAFEVLGFQISTNFLEPKQVITGIRMLQNQIFVLMQAAQTVQIYKYTANEIKLIDKLDQQSINDAGLDFQFSPLDVIKNKNNINKYIIVSTEQVIFITFVNFMNIISKIDCLECSEIRAIYVKDTLALLYQKQLSPQIDYYDCSNFNDIQFKKVVYLPYYRIQQPFQIVQSELIQGFLVRVMSPVTRSTIILIINMNKLMREQVMTYIDLGVYVPDLQYIPMNLADKATNIIFLASYGKTIKSVLIFLNQATKIQVESQYRDRYFTETNIIQTFSSLDSPFLISSAQTIVFLNQFTDLWVNADQGLQINYIRTNKSHFIDINKSWFSGQILNYEVSCQSCVQQQVFVKQVIQEIYVATSLSTFIDYCEYSNELFVILTNQTISFQDQNGYKVRDDLKLTNLNYIQGLICEQGNDNFIIQMDKSNYTLITCQAELSQCQQLNTQPLIPDYSIRSIAMAQQNLLFLVQQYNVQDKAIIVYRFIILENRFEFLPGKFDILTDYWGQNPNLRNALCYKVYLENSMINYRIVIVAYRIGLVYFDAMIDDQGYLILLAQQKGVINLAEILLQSKYNLVMFRQPYFLSVVSKTIIMNFTDVSNKIQVDVIMVTQSSHLCLTLQFNITNFIGLTPTCILAGYSTLYDTGKLYYLDDYFVQAYVDYPLSLVNLYKITHYDDIKLVKERPNLLAGGVQGSVNTFKFSFITKNEDQYKLFYNRNDNQLVHNKINNQAQVVIKNALTFQDQPLTISATNTKTKPASLILKIRTSPEESISKTIFWMIGTLLGVIVVFIIIWCIYRLKLRNRYIQIRNPSD